MPSNRNYTTHWPWNRRKELPSLNAPTSLKNGKIEKTESGGSRFQWCPSDLPEAMRDDWAHTKDEFFYTVNSNNYRATEFNKQDNSNATICLGDSFTFGIGVKDEDTWPYKLNQLLGTVNWNLSSGGSSNKDILYTLHQFISNGYIPKNVYVMWSWSHRKVLSNKINLNAAATFSFDAPPPTSKKLAGSFPYNFIISIVAIAKPAPFTIHPIEPLSFMYARS